MEKFAGKYELVKHENFIEQLIAIGVPKDRIPPIDKEPLDINVDGNKITLSWPKFTSALVLNQEVEEARPNGTSKSFAKLEGENLVVESKRGDGSSGRSVYSLSGSELIIKQTHSKPGIPESTRVFKRI